MIEKLKEKRAAIVSALEHYQQQVSGCMGALKILDELIKEHQDGLHETEAAVCGPTGPAASPGSAADDS